MKRLLIACLLLVFAAAAFGVNTNPVVTGQAVPNAGAEEITLPAVILNYQSQTGELDELLGDTLFVGTSTWDQCHNGQGGRQIGISQAETWEAYLVWTKLFGFIPSNTRHVVYARVTEDGVGGYLVTPPGGGQIPASGYRSGYTTLAYDAVNAHGYGTFHYAAQAGDLFSSVASIQNPFVPTIFNLGTVPNQEAYEHIWPHSTFGNTNHIHMVMHENNADEDNYECTYFRFEPNPATGQLTPATGDGQEILITDLMMNISSDISTSMTGDRVTIATLLSRRFTLGEENGDWSGLALGQSNNDVYLFESTDAGLTWPENGVNISNFIGPDPDALPDTTAANGDTLRAYTDCSVIYTDSDQQHVAFTAHILDYWRQIVYYESRIFHWMKDNQGNDVWTMINHQPFAGQPETWGRTTDRPSLYFDMDTGILWCSFKVCDWGPDTTDYSASSFKAASDVYISASPPGMYNGLLWTKPVDVTNTVYTGGVNGAPPGEGRAETDPNIALRSEGEYLNLFYLLDLDAGTAIATVPEGEVTENPIVWHRIAKQELLDTFEANGQWLQNYPLHFDSTGFWDDPGMWQWEEWGGFFTVDDRGGVSVRENGGLNPDEFDLKQNYPNPFNPSTKIEFSLDRAALVKLAVYDVLGREVTTLVNRGMSAGSHNVIFLADDLPSGVYFYKLNAGGQEKVRKMVLMK